MLFDEMPRLRGKSLLLREMVDDDASALAALAHDEEVYRYLPTFLYEQKYDDAHLVIERMREECFDTHESILLAVSANDDPGLFMGIAEIYAVDELKPKASIGYRLARSSWGRGVATEVCGLLKDYLVDDAGVRTITGHVMVENGASARVLQKNGFVNLYAGLLEDWGRGEPVTIDKWVYKRRWVETGPDTPGKQD